jgi:hypothetical protein
LDALAFPSFVPPFSLENSHRIESLVHYFCNRSFVGSRFHWNKSEAIYLVAGIWAGKFDLRAQELSALALAHGLPESHQDRLEERFEFGHRCLVAGAGLRPVAKWRKPSAIEDVVTDALRRSYNWP